MSLKEITKDLHTAAEKTKFAKKLVTGDLTVEEYANYLWQMVLVYPPIEFGNTMQGFFNRLQGIERAQKIFEDFLELTPGVHSYIWLPSTVEYHRYLIDLMNDPKRKHLIKAHLYVRHMGDLFGGQYIAKAVPGSGKFYQFDDVEGLKAAIREELTEDLGDEARVAFEWAIKIMKELGGE